FLLGAIDDAHAAACDLREKLVFAEALPENDRERLSARRIAHGIGGVSRRTGRHVQRGRARRGRSGRLMDGRLVGHMESSAARLNLVPSNVSGKIAKRNDSFAMIFD